MKIPTKKLKNGFELPVYGLGTWQMGGRDERDPTNDDRADIEAIKESIAQGVIHIDTAEIYAGGYSEELIAVALKESKTKREDIFLVSKVPSEHQGYDGVINACTKSLERLGTSYLDLYLLHDYDNVFPLKETMKAMVELREKGLVKNIGVSNFGIEHLKEAQSYSKYPIVCNQVHYNLRVGEIEKSGLLKYCQENDIMVVAYRPTEKGKLFASKLPESIEVLCKKYKKTFPQLAINWLISQPNVVTIAKTRNPKHLEENLGALGWSMDAKDIEQLRADFPDQVFVSDVIPLG